MLEKFELTERKRPMKIRTWAAAAALIVATAIGATVGGVAVAQSYTHPAAVDNPIATRMCIIRFDESEPRIHVNSTHTCVGVTSVSVEADGDLRLSGPGLGPVGFVGVDEDESLTAAGITCGGSNGDPLIIIRCYSRAGNRINMGGPAIRGAYNNLWVTTFNWTGE